MDEFTRYHESAGFLLTWRTYGTWLPGDRRRWAQHGKGVQPPQPNLEEHARKLLKSKPVRLSWPDRQAVTRRIREYCQYHNWGYQAATCQSNHVHVVLNYLGTEPERIMQKLKARCTRELKAIRSKDAPTQTYWARRGSITFLPHWQAINRAVAYVLNHNR